MRARLRASPLIGGQVDGVERRRTGHGSALGLIVVVAVLLCGGWSCSYLGWMGIYGRGDDQMLIAAAGRHTADEGHVRVSCDGDAVSSTDRPGTMIRGERRRVPRGVEYTDWNERIADRGPLGRRRRAAWFALTDLHMPPDAASCELEMHERGARYRTRVCRVGDSWLPCEAEEVR